MKRTSADGNIGNRYTEGNPSTGVPATVVGAEEMNNIQEEIVNVVLDAGLALNGSNEAQLLEALNIILTRGGTQSKMTCANNVVAADVTGIVFDKTKVKSARMFLTIDRRDDGQDATETGEIFAWHNAETDVWAVAMDTKGDDAEVSFSISAAGQLKYTSSNYSGANYDGNIRITNIVTSAV